MSATSRDLTITGRRHDMLALVRDGDVEYARASGYWLIKGERQVGWNSRTLSELNRAGLIQRTLIKGAKQAKVRDREAATLTKQGRKILTDTPIRPN